MTSDKTIELITDDMTIESLKALANLDKRKKSPAAGQAFALGFLQRILKAIDSNEAQVVIRLKKKIF